MTTAHSAPQAAFALWHRRRRSYPWRIIATASVGAELTARQTAGPSGDYCTLAAGDDPNRPTPRASA